MNNPIPHTIYMARAFIPTNKHDHPLNQNRLEFLYVKLSLQRNHDYVSDDGKVVVMSGYTSNGSSRENGRQCVQYFNASPAKVKGWMAGIEAALEHIGMLIGFYGIKEYNTIKED
jgi:hypothetical protein